MFRLLLSSLAVLLACCTYKTKALAKPAHEGRVRFEVFGVLDEYGHRLIDERTVERFYPYEIFKAAHFESLLKDFCVEEGIEPAVEKEINPQGFITFFSPIVAAKINNYYTDGLLNRSASPKHQRMI